MNDSMNSGIKEEYLKTECPKAECLKQEYLKEDRGLSVCESLIMKTIWDAGEDLSVPELTSALKIRYGKDYARTTMATFLLKLSEKDFVRTYRRGKLSFVHAIRDEEDYMLRRLQEETDFWYGGSVPRLVSALCRAKKLTPKDMEDIRNAYDGLDVSDQPGGD